MSNVDICPGCRMRLRIGRVSRTEENGEAYDEREMICIHKRCSNYGQTISTKKIKIDLAEENHLD